jgi:aryl-phospho-beta-D-glucosidase BglC (GH1 family)
MKKVKRVFTLVLAWLLVFSFYNHVPAQEKKAAPFKPITGWDMMKTLKAGINIGNTLDARQWPGETYADGKDFETIWDNPKITPELFKAIAEKGFIFVRIPVSWAPHMDKDHNISETRMDRVQECVD